MSGVGWFFVHGFENVSMWKVDRTWTRLEHIKSPGDLFACVSIQTYQRGFLTPGVYQRDTDSISRWYSPGLFEQGRCVPA